AAAQPAGHPDERLPAPLAGDGPTAAAA
ncbi:MAG: hypothetical protein JWQ20_3663, partial [Conexibacter sp.]|nr:hypothetical protein [Conexibacter sp.]